MLVGVRMLDYEIGQTVTYTSTQGPRTVVVTKRYESIPHDGRPGFDGHNPKDEKELFWGFDEDITSVEPLDTDSQG
jgi:hypothetical protein